jgi:hypothetical protein
MRRLKMMGLTLLVVLAGLSAAYVVFFRFEGRPPTIDVDPVLELVGKSASFTITVKDDRSGLEELSVVILQEGRPHQVLQETFTRAQSSVTRRVDIKPLALELKDGEADLRITARDRSWRRGGNKAQLSMRIRIDTLPPSLAVLSRLHYLNQGGSGVVVYRSSEPLHQSGVRVGTRFFQGYEIQPGGYVSFFAIPFDFSPKGTPLSLWAVDAAGNETTQGFHHVIRHRRFRRDSIQLSDSFLRRVMPYFMQRDPALRGDLLEAFLKVNGELRRKTERTIREICSRSIPRPLWSGSFLRLKNSKTMSFFADMRDYFYRGKKVDSQVHLGMDLASLASSPVTAANRGKVAFTGELGIYGNTIILDHGCGLFSMYAHLSTIGVMKGQMVEKGQIIGNTGSTGLAGGDHLHFAMLVSGIYVNPVEWWDPKWVSEHVAKRLALLAGGRKPS